MILSTFSLQDSEEPTVLLCTAVSRMPQSHSCCPSVSPTDIKIINRHSTLKQNEAFIVFISVRLSGKNVSVGAISSQPVTEFVALS